jgi:hypothetical protein
MGGKMNLNPLKKDDNTDALVKALEDANNVGAGTPTTDMATPGVVDSAAIAADPQIANGGITPSVPVDVAATNVMSAAPTQQPHPRKTPQPLTLLLQA